MLHDDLKKLNKYPFHMPGHKRNSDFEITGSEIDITEIKGFDNLHSPDGSILEIENNLSDSLMALILSLALMKKTTFTVK